MRRAVAASCILILAFLTMTVRIVNGDGTGGGGGGGDGEPIHVRILEDKSAGACSRRQHGSARDGSRASPAVGATASQKRKSRNPLPKLRNQSRNPRLRR